jgi:hypothetical protein
MILDIPKNELVNQKRVFFLKLIELLGDPKNLTKNIPMLPMNISLK